MYRLPDLRRRDEDGEPLVLLEEVCDMNEALIVKNENMQRAQRHAEREAKRKGGRA